MLFNYKAIDKDGSGKDGSIDAVNVDMAINSLQRRGLVISTIKEAGPKGGILNMEFTFLQRVKNKDVVILSRQMSTLFTAQVSALRIFRLLAAESESIPLRKVLGQVSDDLQGGSSISLALSKHPKVFSNFYVNMVKSGEESGKLDETFVYLAEYLDRNYEVESKVKNALIYPAFVMSTFGAVMILMLTVVIPKISAVILDSGQAVPVYTQIVIGMSSFLINYGWFLLVVVLLGAFLLFRYAQTGAGKDSFARIKIEIPYVGGLYSKLYLSRLSDNMNTLLASGIPMIKALELTSTIIDNKVFEEILNKALDSVKGGAALSDALSRYKEIPGIMIQMIKIGEETGELGNILKTLSKFYQREVMNSVDTLVDLIEPIMIVMLGLGVGFLLASVLIPIYNLSSSL